jgi:hypothetical protein
MLKPVLGGVDRSLHLIVPSMNRLNQTESATFLILPCWPFFRDSYFLYFNYITFLKTRTHEYSNRENVLSVVPSVKYILNVHTIQIISIFTRLNSQYFPIFYFHFLKTSANGINFLQYSMKLI